MKLCVIVPLWALFTLTQQAPPARDKCSCQWTNSEKPFPHEKLSKVEDEATKCNGDITSQKTLELESLLLGLERRLPQLLEDVSMLEREDDGQLYAVISLQVIENELMEINQLMARLNRTTLGNLQLTNDTTEQVKELRAEMEELETYDSMRVVKTNRANRDLKKDLEKCKSNDTLEEPTPPARGNCPRGQFVNITGPTVFTAGEYPGSYKYGAWGRDPKPEAGKENWYWRVMLTSSDVFANYVRLYTTLSSLILGVSTPGNFEIDDSNPTTNTIQGPNAVMYAGALYYNCYDTDSVCRFNLIDKTVSTLQLPKGTRYNSKGNFCHLEECYPYTDLDLATDESGVWVIYTTTQDFGNLVVSKVDEDELEPTPAPDAEQIHNTLRLGQTWHTSVYKQGVTNTFMACGVLYATRYVTKDMEEIFYALDTTTGQEKFGLGIFINKMSPSILSLNYSPVDQMLHAYMDSKMVSYKVLFR